MKAMALHDNGIALIFARTETETFFKWVWPYASALLFLSGRVWFHRPCGKQADNNGGAPSVLIAYGADNAQKLWDSKLPGAFVWNQRLVLPINPD